MLTPFSFTLLTQILSLTIPLSDIRAYANSRTPQNALFLFQQMLEGPVFPDKYSFTFVLKACAGFGGVQEGRQIYGYLSTGLLEEAGSVFNRMPVKDVVSWNAMITGYAHTSCFGEVLLLFEDMQCEEVRPDNCTLVNVLSACAHLGALRNDSQKDISTWNSIIVGLGMHGFGENALETFSEMLVKGFGPNEVTFIAVLSACSRAGLLNEGRHMFQLMVDDYGIQPTIEHYGCMVDLLGGMGLLEEALDLVKTRPLKEAHVL
ncbi:hypothetical protein CRYUN_Cryun31cG0043500 [Craigia yunnanensis]